MKSFKELTQAEVFAFANANGLPTSETKRSFVEREYEKALKRGIVEDPMTRMRLKMMRAPMLIENFVFNS